MLGAAAAGAQAPASLPASFEPVTRRTIEALADSLRAAGLPSQPIYAKAAEGKLKQATDAQIVEAVRKLARRFGEIRSALGSSIDAPAMNSAATALAVGVPMPALVELWNTAGSGASADFATALITLTDLIDQRVPITSASNAVASLLARRAATDQYARLRVEVHDEIGAGRSPEQAIRARTEAIVKSLPTNLPAVGAKPPR